MEVSSVNKPNANIKKQLLVPESKYLPIPSSTIESVGADDERDTNKCNHFSIRGYVAEVRKRDTKINWPFQILKNPLDEHACVLPPLSVTTFRWWNCQNCVHETLASKAVTENEAVVSFQNNKVKFGNGLLLVNDTVPSHPDVTESVSVFPLLSHPDVIKDLVKEGTKISTVGQDRSDEDQNHLSKANVNSIDTDACQTGEQGHAVVSASNQNHLSKLNVNSIDRDACQTGEGCVMLSASTSEVGLLGGATPNIVSLKRKGSEQIQVNNGAEMSDEMITSMTNSIAASCPSNDQLLSKVGEVKELGNCAAKEYGMLLLPLRVNVSVPRFDALTAMSVDISDYESISLYKGRQKVSSNKFHLTNNIVQLQVDAPQTSISAENFNHRKARKVRLLEDIMRSDKQHRTENLYTPNGDIRCSGNDHSRRPDVSKENIQHLGRDSHQNTELKPMKTKNSIEAVINDDERPSLMHWVKKTPKQKISCKRDSEAQGITNVTGTSKFVAKQSAEKVPDLNLEVCGEKETNREIIVGKKNQIPEVNLAQRSVIPAQDSMTWKGHKINLPQPSVIPAQDSMTWRGHKISKDLVRKFSHSAVNSKSAGVVIAEKNHHIETRDNSHKMAPFSKMKNKRPQVEDGGPSQIHWPKDSFSLQKQAGYQVQEKVTKKQRTVRTLEKEISDDIPMDIVELLARNQHERKLMNAEAATENMQTTMEMTEDINNDNNRSIIDCHGDKMSDVVHRNLFQRNSVSSTKGYSVQTSESKDNSNYKANHSSTNVKQNLNIDLNLQAPISASTDFQAFSQYVGLSMKGSQLAVTETGREGSTQNFCWNGTTILASGSNHNEPSTSGQDSCRNAHDGPLALLNGTPFVTNPRKVDSNFSHLEKGYNTSFLQKAGYWKHIDSADTYIWSKDKDQSCTNGGPPEAASSYLDSGYVSPSNSMGPAGLYPNDTGSHLNLLRLMDRAASSAELCHSSLGNNCIGPTWGSAVYGNCQGNKLLGSGVETISTEVFQHPLTVGMLDRDPQLGNSCKPLRPLPRFGILGPLLQKEIADNSNKCRTPFGLGAKIADELTPLKNNEKDNGEASQSTTCFNVLNARTSITRCQNSKWIPPSGFRSHPSFSLMRSDNGLVGTGNMDVAVQHLSSSFVAEKCVLNRNPADFSIPDEDNPYMIGNEEQGPAYMPTSGRLRHPTYFDRHKQQKVMKLNDLKSSVRS